MSSFCREYSVACEEREFLCQNFRKQRGHRFGRQSAVQYPEHCHNLPNFAEWLKQEVQGRRSEPRRLSVDVQEALKLPEIIATAYRAMYAHGMHLRVQSAEEEKVTSDSGVAASVLCMNNGRLSNNEGKWQTVEYVGWIQEIIELDYRSHCCVVLVCSWIPAKLGASNANVIRDRYGFTVANFANILPLGPNSFAFLTQCQQVFYSDDIVRRNSHGGDWKVVCGTDVRGRHGDSKVLKPDLEILATGRDSKFEGLRIEH